ncbi:MAG: ANTAR domain-containing protein [Acidimicrobiales bacterium]
MAVTTRRLARILDLLGQLGDPDASLDWLCGTCAQQLEVSGAAVALILSGHDPGKIAASDEVAAAIVDLQFSTGEGPAIDAHRSRRAVLEPELSSTTRWPAFAPEAVAVGAAAIFALPLQVGAARFGALTLYRGEPGPLGEGVLADALAMAEVACEITLGLQAQVPPGSLHEVLDQLAATRTVLYQATGMVVVQLDASPEEAVAAIRARAYATGRPAGEVAADLVARRLRFDR